MPRREGSLGPGGAANCWIPAAGPSLHPLEKFLARPSLPPPSGGSSGSARPAPTSWPALGRRAGWGPRGPRQQLAASRAAEGLGRGWERPAASAPAESDFQTRACVAAAPGQPRARSVRDPAGRRPRGEWPSLLPSPSASGRARSHSEALTLLGPRPSSPRSGDSGWPRRARGCVGAFQGEPAEDRSPGGSRTDTFSVL